MKKTLFNITKANALNVTTVKHNITNAAKVKVKDVNAIVSNETLYPGTGDIDGLDTAHTYAVLWLATLGKVKLYKDGLCAKDGRKKICEVYFVESDGRIHIYANDEMIKAWSKKYKGFLTETKTWSRFEFLYNDFLKMVEDTIF